jgi:hypothetical protein
MSRKIAFATRVRITVGGKYILATLASSEAARDFASLLPLRLAMNDLFRREKFAPLPRPIAEQGTRTHDYAVGTMVTGHQVPTWQSSIARTASEFPILG